MRLLYALPFLVILAAISVFAGPQPCTQPAAPYVYFSTMQHLSGTYVDPAAVPSYLTVPSPTFTVGGGASSGYCATTGQTATIQEVEIFKRVNNGAWTSILKRSFSGVTSAQVSTTDSIVGGTGNVPIEYKVVSKDNFGQFATVSGYVINQDTSNPAVTGVSGIPLAGQGSASGTVTITPTVSDSTWYPGSISSVFYQVDGNSLGVFGTQFPWSISYDTRQLSNTQPHTLNVTVLDKSGRIGNYVQPFTVNNPSSQTLPPPSSIGGGYGGGVVDLIWPPVSGAVKHYTVYRDNYFIGKTKVASFTDFAPRAGATHVYRVSTTNTLGIEGVNSTPRNYTIPPATGIPVGTIAPAISGIKMLTVPAGPGISYLVYQIETPYPATCTASTVTSSSYPVLGGGLTRLTAPGVFRHNFAVGQGPGYYSIQPSCSYTCGDHICQASNVSGDEKQGLPGASPDSCPQDCGCPNGQTYNTVSQQCETLCPVLFDNPPPAETFRRGDCTSNQAFGGYTAPSFYCPNTGDVCGRCAPGRYSNINGVFTCDKFKANDNICAWDVGEWDAWYVNGQLPGEDCATFTCPVGYGPPGTDCPIGYTGPASPLCGGVNLPCKAGCPIKDPLVLGCA